MYCSTCRGSSTGCWATGKVEKCFCQCHEVDALENKARREGAIAEQERILALMSNFNTTQYTKTDVLIRLKDLRLEATGDGIGPSGFLTDDKRKQRGYQPPLASSPSNPSPAKSECKDIDDG
jgi:hypothetical protein